MTREIKFRAWDKCKTTFLPDDVWAVITNDFNALGVMIKDWEEYRAGEYLYEDTQAVMQYTGLKDKNGTDIYEGDIVSAWSEGYNHKGEIRWMLEGMPRIIIYPAFGNQGFWHLHGSLRAPGLMNISIDGKVEYQKGENRYIIDDGVEVIGNLYQTPELTHAN